MKANFPKVVDFVEGNGFESMMGVIIMYNCLTIGIEVHLCPPADSVRTKKECPEDFLVASEHICTAIFVAEFFVRGLCCGAKYHISGWDKLADCFLVWGTGVLLTWIIVPLTDGGPSQIRMLTALRAFRLLRVARVIRFNFKEMWLMLRGLAGSSKCLGSMMAVFVFVFYLFGILAVTMIADSTSWDQDDDDLMVVHGFFNGLDKAMWTLLQVITADSWCSGIARPVMDVIPWMWIYFVCYIAIAMMVLMNLVTAIIVENAMNQSKEDQEQLLKELEVKKEQEFKHLQKMFLALDQDGSGELDEAEFADALDAQPEIIDQFKLLGFDENEIRNFFTDLDNGDGSLSTDEFIGGLQSMQGSARSADLIRTQKSVERLTRRMDKLLHHFGITEGDGGDGGASTAASRGFQSNFAKAKNEGEAEDEQYNIPGQMPGGRTGALEVSQEQIDINREISERLNAISKDIQRSIDKRLNDVQASMNHLMMDAVSKPSSAPAGGSTTVESKPHKTWLYDVRVAVAEVCRKELYAWSVQRDVLNSYDSSPYPSVSGIQHWPGTPPPKPVSPPPPLSSPNGFYGQGLQNRHLPRAPSIPRKKDIVNPPYEV